MVASQLPVDLRATVLERLELELGIYPPEFIEHLKQKGLRSLSVVGGMTGRLPSGKFYLLGGFVAPVEGQGLTVYLAGTRAFGAMSFSDLVHHEA